MQQSYFKNTINLTARGLLLLRFSVIRRAGLSLLSSYWRNYFKVQRSSENQVLHDVSLAVDGKIPFNASSLWPYLGFAFTFVGLLGYLHHARGREILSELEAFVLDIADLYEDGGSVFRKSQTTFTRTGTSLAISFLRLIDQEKNAAPSLHVAFAAFIYFRGAELVRKYNIGEIESTELELLAFAARVVDSTLYIKQHCVRDVALGLALVSFKHVDFDFYAQRLIDHLFVHSGVVVPVDVAYEARYEIRVEYSKTHTLPQMVTYLSALPLHATPI